MTAMTMEFDGVRELSAGEVGAVAGAGARGAALMPALGRVLDYFGNQDGDPFDEAVAIGAAATAGLGAAGTAGCAPCGAAAAGTALVTAGFGLADTFGT
ncbi:MAG: hypothetical protein RKE49_01790 [Oceanicaulis sp.]